jgi:hypothetical protein
MTEIGEVSFRNRRLAASVFLVDLPALRPLKSVPLQIERLIIGRDASVANAHIANPKNGSRLWIVHFEMASPIHSAMDRSCFHRLERCGENQGLWDARPNHRDNPQLYEPTQKERRPLTFFCILCTRSFESFCLLF